MASFHPIHWIARFVGCLLAVALLVSAGVCRAQPVTLMDAEYGISLVGRMDHLIDESAKWNINDVRSERLAASFQTPAGLISQGRDARAHWFRIQVDQTHADGLWVLEMPSIAANDVQFHGPFAGSGPGPALAPPVITGQDHPFATRPLGSERFAFPFHLRQPGVHTLYLRVVSSTNQKHEFKVWERSRFVASQHPKMMFDGICYGILIGMVLYNLNLLFVFRDRTYAYYVLGSLFALLGNAGYNGHLAHYLAPNHPSLVYIGLSLFPTLWLLFSTLFANAFLDLKRYAPAGHLALRIGTALTLVPIGLSLAGQTQWAQSLLEILAIALTCLVLVSTVLAWRQGYRPAGWYLAGQAALFGSVFASVATNWGWVYWPFIQTNGLQLGVAIEVVVFSMALGSRIRLLKMMQLELAAQARHMTRAAQTDPLTGLANRSGLQARAASMLAEQGERSLMLLDLDHFKPINDIHGHEAGDKVLVVVAQRLQEQLRPGDSVARIGGDEFVILLDRMLERERLEAIARRLLDSIQQPIAHEQGHLQVGGSLGIAIYPQHGSSLADLLRAADSAMYRIKKRGRASYGFFGESEETVPPGQSTFG